MQITKKELEEKTFYVKPVGRLDINTVPEFQKELADVATNYNNLIIDFSEVNFISSIGLRVLLEMHKAMSEKGSMKLTNVSFDIMYIFNMTGFNKILNIE